MGLSFACTHDWFLVGPVKAVYALMPTALGMVECGVYMYGTVLWGKGMRQGIRYVDQ